MPAGPLIIFDKSALQMLSVDESAWLDNFYRTNITPLFYVETLADLEKPSPANRTPEDVVSLIAARTPDQDTSANIHHDSILYSELNGTFALDAARPKPVIGGGQLVAFKGAAGMIYKNRPEDEALQRWQRREFLKIERENAKQWRLSLSRVDNEIYYHSFKRFYEKNQKPISLSEVKKLVDRIVNDSRAQDWLLSFGLELLFIPSALRTRAKERWVMAGKPLIKKQFPFFHHMFTIDFFFYLGMAADLISRTRSSHRVDIAYLYYLPFCMIFTSNDKLHANVAPLFLREDQTFVKGDELKADLKKINEYYSALPEATLQKGMMSFAKEPPRDASFLTTRLWDKYLPDWRELADNPPVLSKQMQDALLQLINSFKSGAVPLDPEIKVPFEKIEQLSIEKQVSLRRGKWRRFSPEVEEEALAQRPSVLASEENA